MERGFSLGVSNGVKTRQLPPPCPSLPPAAPCPPPPSLPLSLQTGCPPHPPARLPAQPGEGGRVGHRSPPRGGHLAGSSNETRGIEGGRGGSGEMAAGPRGLLPVQMQVVNRSLSRAEREPTRTPWLLRREGCSSHPRGARLRSRAHPHCSPRRVGHRGDRLPWTLIPGLGGASLLGSVEQRDFSPSRGSLGSDLSARPEPRIKPALPQSRTPGFNPNHQHLHGDA